MFLKARDSLWYLDSDFSRHITGDKSKLIDFVLKEGGYVTFGDNNKGRIMGEWNIGNQHKTQIKMFCISMDLSTISYT